MTGLPRSEIGEGLTGMPPTSADRSDLGTINAPGKNRTPDDRPRRANPAGDRCRRELRTWFFSLAAHRICGWPATSSRRRARSRRAHDMHTYTRRQRHRHGPFCLRFGRFGFGTANRPNRESQDGGGRLVDLVDLVVSFRGCMRKGALAPALPPARPPAARPLPPERTNQIDQIDQTPAPYRGYDLVDLEIPDQITDQTGRLSR